MPKNNNQIDLNSAIERKLKPTKVGAIYLGGGEHLIEFTSGEEIITADYTGDFWYEQLKRIRKRKSNREVHATRRKKGNERCLEKQ